MYGRELTSVPSSPLTKDVWSTIASQATKETIVDYGDQSIWSSLYRRWELWLFVVLAAPIFMMLPSNYAWLGILASSFIGTLVVLYSVERNRARGDKVQKWISKQITGVNFSAIVLFACLVPTLFLKDGIAKDGGATVSMLDVAMSHPVGWWLVIPAIVGPLILLVLDQYKRIWLQALIVIMIFVIYFVISDLYVDSEHYPPGPISDITTLLAIIAFFGSLGLIAANWLVARERSRVDARRGESS